MFKPYKKTMDNKVEAVLASYLNEREALSIVRWATDSMHREVGESYVKYCENYSDQELRIFFDKIVHDGLATSLEYIPMVWKIMNVSRALQQQLTRYRVGTSFCIESMRVVDKKDFAKKKNYHTPKGISDKQELKEKYNKAMHIIESLYNELLECGISTEDARGILPLNIYSSITFAVNFRSLMHILSTRCCLKTQGEFKDLAELMLKEIDNKMGSTIANSIKKPCENGHCIMLEENTSAIEDVVKGLKPRRPICPLFKVFFPELNKYIEKYVTDFEEKQFSKYEM